MKETKIEKGITLIALIITIVILLILAAVAITAVQNQGIIEYANNAATSYQNKKDDEGGILDSYEDTLKNHSQGTSTQPCTTHSWKLDGPSYSYPNSWNLDSICTNCNKKCTHTTKRFSYSSNEYDIGYRHEVTAYCNSDCKLLYAFYYEECVDNGDYICDLCGNFTYEHNYSS